MDLIIQNARVIDPYQDIDLVGDIFVKDGLVDHVGPSMDVSRSAKRVIDAQGLIASPGFMDLHCHLRDPGFESKETIVTGTKAAAKGGFTTICCMPNTEPPMDTPAVVQYVKDQAKRASQVRVYPIGCVTKAREGKALSNMYALAQSGVVLYSDDGSPVHDPDLMRMALAYAGDLGLAISNHCEDPVLSRGGVMHEGDVSMRLGLPGIPSTAEEIMVARDIALAENTGGLLHIAHVSTAGSVELVKQAKDRGLNITAEVTPHHLTMSDFWVAGKTTGENILDPLTSEAYDTNARVYPPLRSSADVNAVVEGLRTGIIDCIATDHAPHDKISKGGTYEEAENGISVLETAFGSLMSLVHNGRIGLAELIERLTVGPARVLGNDFLQFASLKPGTPADIVMLDPEKEWIVDTKEFLSKGKNTPLHGTKFNGKVVMTLVGGQIVWEE